MNFYKIHLLILIQIKKCTKIRAKKRVFFVYAFNEKSVSNTCYEFCMNLKKVITRRDGGIVVGFVILGSE